MPVNMQNLHNLANINSLDQLKLGADNQLQKRSGIGTFFRKVGDAFLKLSHAGRAAIAQRNEAILNAMRTAVDNARATVQAEDRPTAQRLSSVLARIQTATANMDGGALEGLKGSVASLQQKTAELQYGLHGDARYTALSPRAQQGLVYALETISKGSSDNKQADMERVKNDFFGVRPDTYDIDEGMRQFSESLIEDFLKPSQQALVDGNGIHNSFKLDTSRNCMTNIGDVATPGNQPEEFYENALKNTVPAEHHRFLPFISMMCSQAGMDSAKSFLPYMSGLSDPADSHLTAAGLMPPNNAEHKVSLTCEGNTLRLTDTFAQPFNMIDDMAGAAVLSYRGNVTMTIDLAAEPRIETVNGKEVLIPQFVLENGDVHFETP